MVWEIIALQDCLTIPDAWRDNLGRQMRGAEGLDGTRRARMRKQENPDSDVDIQHPADG